MCVCVLPLLRKSKKPLKYSSYLCNELVKLRLKPILTLPFTSQNMQTLHHMSREGSQGWPGAGVGQSVCPKAWQGTCDSHQHGGPVLGGGGAAPSKHLSQRCHHDCEQDSASLGSAGWVQPLERTAADRQQSLGRVGHTGTVLI